MQFPITRTGPGDLEHNPKGDLFLAAVARVHGARLTSLDLAACNGVSDTGLACLAAECTQLACFTLYPGYEVGHLAGVTEHGLRELLKRNPGITALDLRECDDQVTDNLLTCVVQVCQQLAKLNVSGCSNLTTESLAGLVACPIASLDLELCDGVTDAVLAIWASSSMKDTLVHLDVSTRHDSSAVSDGGLAGLLRGCRHLVPNELLSSRKGDEFCAAIAEVRPDVKEVSLMYAEATDAGMECLASGCPDLETLNLKYCSNVTHIGLKALASGCHRLKSISMSTSFQDIVVDGGLAALLDGCPELQSSNVDAGNWKFGKEAELVKAVFEVAGRS